MARFLIISLIFSNFSSCLNFILINQIHIDLFILKNMGAAIIDFRVCPPLVKCQNLLFSGFIDTLMYGFSSTGVTIYNDIMTTNKLPGMYFFLITVIFPIQNQYKSYLIKNCMHFFSFFVFLLLFKHKKKG